MPATWHTTRSEQAERPLAFCHPGCHRDREAAASDQQTGDDHHLARCRKIAQQLRGLGIDLTDQGWRADERKRPVKNRLRARDRRGQTVRRNDSHRDGETSPIGLAMCGRPSCRRRDRNQSRHGHESEVVAASGAPERQRPSAGLSPPLRRAPRERCGVDSAALLAKRCRDANVGACPG